MTLRHFWWVIPYAAIGWVVWLYLHWTYIDQLNGWGPDGHCAGLGDMAGCPPVDGSRIWVPFWSFVGLIPFGVTTWRLHRQRTTNRSNSAMPLRLRDD